MTRRLALDTDTPLDLEPLGDMLLTYADLMTAAALHKLQARWPEVGLIDRGLGDPLDRASIIDVEIHAEGVAAVPRFLDRVQARDSQPGTTYCDRSQLAAVDAAAGGRRHWRWVATLDGTLVIPGLPPLRRPAAVQCFNSAMLGVHADGSVVLAAAWHPAR